ncbi:hypothetical protein KIH74_01425 [Kineosporia sp. J2-2]|uniref:RlpA-like protein double-psi beta-barrel domain-containing protein n=1 Tax=Kineosporia corallincola TaxID=2835133 RepID=A0ABS5TAU0_9ACTN|nr:expansin EXLX1 family cellulose-binding protein [Kineosporia corallincola]MBT0767564.1 hypothetical protein [Kineosporia corallincola]
MSRKKLDVRAATALVAFAVIAVTGGVFYAQSSTSSTADASLVLSRPDVAIAQEAQGPAETPDSGPAATPSATPTAKKKEKKPEEKKAEKADSTEKTKPVKAASADATKSTGSSSSSGGSGSTTAKAAASAANDEVQFGKTYDGIATFYGATGAGNCSYEPTGDLMVAAMNEQQYDGSQTCGAYVDVTGPKGNTVRVKIVDRCPECAAGHIDLSAEAFAELAEPVTGRIDITWKMVSPSVSGPVKYVYKEGSTQWWCGIQVRNHRNPIRKVELKGDNGWVTLDRQMYNYFLSASGEGCGGTVRITDVQGNQLTDSGISVKPGVEQAGAQQLPAA